MTMHNDTSTASTLKSAANDLLPNQDEMKGKWNQLKGDIKVKFGRLTDDDLLKAEGSIDKMVGVLQERYGYSKEQAQGEWDRFMGNREKSGDSQPSVSSIASNVKEVATSTLNQGKQVVSETLDEVANKADSLVTEQKQQAVRKLEGVSGALRTSSNQFRQDEQETFADYANAAADYVDDFSNFLRNRRPMELWSDVQDFARRQPEVFVLGTLAAGFLLGRFLHSSNASSEKVSHAGQVTPTRYLKSQPNRPNYQTASTAQKFSGSQDIRNQGGSSAPDQKWQKEMTQGQGDSGKPSLPNTLTTPIRSADRT